MNNILIADGHSGLTIVQIDQQGMRFPNLNTPVADYGTKQSTFWWQRSVAIGTYVHNNVRDAFHNRPGLSYHLTGPDFTYARDEKIAFFEILPDTGASLKAHSARGMKTYLYRTVFYNRNAINNPGDADEEE